MGLLSKSAPQSAPTLSGSASPTHSLCYGSQTEHPADEAKTKRCLTMNPFSLHLGDESHIYVYLLYLSMRTFFYIFFPLSH